MNPYHALLRLLDAIVSAILDLSGYVADLPLHRMRLLEPSFGGGEFLLADAGELSRHWLLCDDFLLCELSGEFDIIVGNPPYSRQEHILEALLREYRARFRTMFDRADIYVAFYERALDLLMPGGRLGFICANCWMKNRYGGPLREKIVSGFALQHHIDMEDIDAFHSEVIAYPAITVVQRTTHGTTKTTPPTRVARSKAVEDERGLPKLVSAMLADPADPALIGQISLLGSGEAPWLR